MKPTLQPLQRAIACVVTYHGPTDTRGSRVKLTLPRFNRSRVISFDHVFNNSAEIAQAFLEREGITVCASCEAKGHDILVLPWQTETLGKVFNF